MITARGRMVGRILGLPASASHDEVLAAAKALRERGEEAHLEHVQTAHRLIDVAVERRLLPYAHRRPLHELAATQPGAIAEIIERAPPAPSFEQQLRQLADQKAMASGLPFAVALHQVTSENPDLVTLYRREQMRWLRRETP
jgi:hypothetical protein